VHFADAFTPPNGADQLERWPSVYLFAPAAQLKPLELSPFDVLERIMLIGLVIYVGIILLIFVLKRGLAWLDDRFWITYTGHVPTYGTLGNAFLELQSLAQPEKQYIIEMKEDEKQKKEEDDKTEPRP
jgi:hypothetical protein